MGAMCSLRVLVPLDQIVVGVVNADHSINVSGCRIAPQNNLPDGAALRVSKRLSGKCSN
jgi:hypothetical protein